MSTRTRRTASRLRSCNTSRSVISWPGKMPQMPPTILPYIAAEKLTIKDEEPNGVAIRRVGASSWVRKPLRWERRAYPMRSPG